MKNRVNVRHCIRTAFISGICILFGRAGATAIASAPAGTPDRADELIVADVLAAPIMRPRVIETKARAEQAEVWAAYGAVLRNPPQRMPGEDQVAFDRRTNPLPTVYVRKSVAQIGANAPGVEEVCGYDIATESQADMEKVRATGRAITGGAEPLLLPPLWRYTIPKPLRYSWWAEGQQNRLEPWFALSLFDPVSWDNRDPELLFFDTRSGLKWRAPVPLLASVAEAAARPDVDHREGKTFGMPHLGSIKFALSSDGKRVIEIVSLPHRRTVYAYVYDGAGKLLRRIAWSNWYSYTAEYTLVRLQDGHRFILDLERDREGDPTGGQERCVIDDEGRLVGRLVGSKGQVPNTAFHASEDGRYFLVPGGTTADVYDLSPAAAPK